MWSEKCILKTYSTSYSVAAERVRVTVRVRPPTRAEQKEEDGAPFIFLDTDKNTVILRRKYVLSPVCTDIQFDTLQLMLCSSYLMGRILMQGYVSHVYPPEVYGLANKTVLDMCRGSFVDFTEFQFDAVLPSTALQVDVYNMAARAVVLVHTKT